MTVEAVRYLCQDSKLAVSFAFYAGNNRLQRKIGDDSNRVRRILPCCPSISGPSAITGLSIPDPVGEKSDTSRR